MYFYSILNFLRPLLGGWNFLPPSLPEAAVSAVEAEEAEAVRLDLLKKQTMQSINTFVHIVSEVTSASEIVRDKDYCCTMVFLVLIKSNNLSPGGISGLNGLQPSSSSPCSCCCCSCDADDADAVLRVLALLAQRDLDEEEDFAALPLDEEDEVEETVFLFLFAWGDGGAASSSSSMASKPATASDSGMSVRVAEAARWARRREDLEGNRN